TFKLRAAKFSDGSPITADDAAFSLLRIRDNKASLWSDPFSLINTAKASDPQTLVVTLKTPAVAFLSQLASPTVSILSEKAMTKMGEAAYSESPVTSCGFTVDEWRKGDRVILKKNPNVWQASNVSLDGVEWVSVTDDNTRMRMVQNN